MRGALARHTTKLSFVSVFLHRASRTYELMRSDLVPALVILGTVRTITCHVTHVSLLPERIHASSWTSASSPLRGQTPTLQNLPLLLTAALSDDSKRAMDSAALERSHLCCSCILDTYGYPYK